jgi:hypothetical protein
MFHRINVMIPCADGFMTVDRAGHICIVGSYAAAQPHDFATSELRQPDVIAGASFTPPNAADPNTTVALIKHTTSPTEDILYTYRIFPNRTISSGTELARLPQPFKQNRDSISMVAYDDRLCVTVYYATGLLQRIYVP